jgi:hypothetical protein
MWTLQKLTWLVFWRKAKWGGSENLCAYIKKNRQRKHKKCDLNPIIRFYFKAIAASKSPAVNKFKQEGCQNVVLITPNNADYLVHIRKIINAFHAKRPKDYVPRPPSNLYVASKMTECIVRSCYGWGYARIIRYDAPAGSPSGRTYMECDVIRSDAAGSTVFVGETKSYAARKPSATAQLHKRCSVLATCFRHVIPMFFSVKMSSMEKTQDMLHPIPQAVTHKGFLYLHVALTFKDVLDYASQARLQYDAKLVLDAFAEAKETAAKFVQKKNKQQQNKYYGNTCI